MSRINCEINLILTWPANCFIIDAPINPIQDGLFWGCSRMRLEDFLFPLPKICHISYNDETWHSYTLPKEDPKNV